MTRLLALLFACLALGLVVAGCGGDDDDEGDGGSAETQEQPTQEQPAPGADHDRGAEDGNGAEGGGGPTEVSMEGIKFNPAEVTVEAGDTVTWVNDDSVGHDVTGDDFKSGEPGAMQNGDTFDQTFDSAGAFDYVCTVHAGMEGTVTVE